MLTERRSGEPLDVPQFLNRTVLPIARGAWVTATAYKPFDWVSNNGSSYIAYVTHTSGASTEPGDGASWATVWYLVASKGTDGEDGEDGDDARIDPLEARAAGMVSRTRRAAWTLEGGQFVGEVDHNGIVRMSPQPRVRWQKEIISGQVWIHSLALGSRQITYDASRTHTAELNGIELYVIQHSGGVPVGERYYYMDGTLQIASGTQAIAHTLTHGQSVAVGSGSEQALSTVTPAGGEVLMFNIGCKTLGSSHAQREVNWPIPFRNLNRMVPAVERIYSPAAGVGVTAEGPDTQRGRELTQSGRLPANHSALVSNHAIGATAYSDIKKGTKSYDNLIEAVHRAHFITKKEGLHYYVPGIHWDQGEAHTGAGPGDYLAFLVELQADLETDIVKIVGAANVGAGSATAAGTGVLPIALGQLHNVSVGATTSFVPQDQLQAMITYPTKFIVWPKYQWETVVDGVHLDAWGQAGNGAYAGRAIANHHNGDYGGGLYCLTAVRTGANIVMTFKRPFGGGDIEFATETIAELADNNKGFTWLQTGGTARTISTVTVTGALEVTIALSGDPGSPSVQEVGIAWVGTLGQPGGPTTGVRSTLRSPSTEDSLFPVAEGSGTTEMHHYAMQQLITVT